jgi:predicted phage tail protein
MTSIKLYGLLADEFGHSFSMEIDEPKDVFDAIDANRFGFKKRIFDLGSSGFHYCVIVDGKKIENPKEILRKQKAKTIDLVPILSGDGPPTWVAIAIVVVSTALQIILAPDPPKPPEVQGTSSALEKSFTFSSVQNRAAQGTPVPVCYGELLVGSEIIQTCLKSYPQNQETFKAFRRNPLNETTRKTEASSQIVDL